MTTDPICGMPIEETKAAGTSLYNGRLYYFCSTACKTAFDQNPSAYVTPADAQPNPPPEDVKARTGR
jgi:YHS domain-containing protein